MKEIAAKLVKIMEAVHKIEKTGVNTAQGYNYVEEAEVALAVRKALIEFNVALIPSLRGVERIPIKSRSGGTGFLTTVTMEYTIVDADSGELFTFLMMGDGQDYGDKGLYKAITGAHKYALLKLVCATSKNDPEASEAELPEMPPEDTGYISPGPKAQQPVQAQRRPLSVAPVPARTVVAGGASGVNTPRFGDYPDMPIETVPTDALEGYAASLERSIKNPTTANAKKFLSVNKKAYEAILTEILSRGGRDAGGAEGVMESDEVDQSLDEDIGAGFDEEQLRVFNDYSNAILAIKNVAEGVKIMAKANADPVLYPDQKLTLADTFNEVIAKIRK